MTFVEEAEQLAQQHHHGQKYLDQTYMDGHIYPVVLQAELIARGAKLSSTEVDCVMAIAYCHDLVEDTTVSIDMIQDIDRVPTAVPNAVAALTKEFGQPHGEYLETIAKCSVYAAIVKLADSMVNLRSSLSTGTSSKILEYSNNVNYLSTVVCREIDRRKNAY